MSERKELYRRSANGEGQIVSYIWPVQHPHAVVQFVHNIGEHASRYDDFARALNNAGYTVVANDLPGHGMSKQGHKGAFAMKKKVLPFLLEDINSLFRVIDEDHEGLPHILIGMGSGVLLAELYASLYDHLAMVVAIGTPSAPKAISAIRIAMSRHIRANGYNSVSESIHHMMFPLNKQPGSDPMNQNFWLSTEEDVVRQYTEDEDCGFMLTSSGYRELLFFFKELKGKHGLSAMPDIPIYFMSGSEDQLGECGIAVNKHVTAISKTGHDQVAFKLYKGCYSDILHDTCREQVIDDLVTWMDLNLRAQK